MASIIGADAAVVQRCPVLPAIIKAAEKRGMMLSPSTHYILDTEEKWRVKLAKVKLLTDAWPVSRLEWQAFPHQRAALHYFRMANMPAYLVADKTGVGKTLQALLWASVIVKARSILIITKNIAKEQWSDAIHQWIGRHEQITIVQGTIAEQIVQASTREGWVIGHWESLTHARLGYRQRPWDAIIFDEAQYMANRKALRSLNAYKLRSLARMACTAHPFSKDPGELFSILKFLYPDVYRSYWRFFHMHVKASPRPFGGFDIKGARRPKLLRWEIAPFTISRTKQEVFKSLPRITHPSAISVALTTSGKREYDRLRKQAFAELAALGGGDKYVPIINDLARVTRMRQYLIDPALVGGREKSVKYPAILELLDQIDAPTVIFTEFRQAAQHLGVFLAKQRLTVGYIHGGMHKKIREVKKRFLRGDFNALIVVSAAGDTALNLGGYGYVIHLDLPWTPRDFEQRDGRVDRPEEGTGKLVPTTSYRVIVTDSYEQRMERRLIDRHSTFTGVFTVGELRKLFT
jgi:SNF2 family DNA or RNA helicase